MMKSNSSGKKFEAEFIPAKDMVS